MTPLSPCSSCPFRSDIDFYLSAEKARAIIAALQNDGDFACHNATVATGHQPGPARACLGAAIFLEHMLAGGVRANRAFRIREGCLNEFSRDELPLDAAIFKDAATFLLTRAPLELGSATNAAPPSS